MEIYNNGVITFKTGGSNYNKDIDENNPDYDFIKNSKSQVILFNTFFDANILNLPDNITCIVFKKSVDFINKKLVLPPKLEILVLPQRVTCILNFPETLKLLIVHEYPVALDNLPADLHELRLLNGYEHKIDCFPVNLKKLIVGNSYNHTLDNLPEGLLSLICINFNQPIDNFPNSLINVEFGRDFQQSINLLSDSIKYLNLNVDYARPIYKYPNNLEELIISDIGYWGDYKFILDFSLLPDSVKNIKILSLQFEFLNIDKINNLPNLTRITVKSYDLYNKLSEIIINEDKIKLFFTKIK